MIGDGEMRSICTPHPFLSPDLRCGGKSNSCHHSFGSPGRGEADDGRESEGSGTTTRLSKENEVTLKPNHKERANIPKHRKTLPIRPSRIILLFSLPLSPPHFHHLLPARRLPSRHHRGSDLPFSFPLFVRVCVPGFPARVVFTRRAHCWRSCRAWWLKGSRLCHLCYPMQQINMDI